MMYYDHGMGVGWLLVVLLVVLPALLLATGLVVTQLRRDPGEESAARPVAVEESAARPVAVREAEHILAGRFARGEIDAEEYEQRLRTLHSATR